MNILAKYFKLCCQTPVDFTFANNNKNNKNNNKKKNNKNNKKNPHQNLSDGEFDTKDQVLYYYY